MELPLWPPVLFLALGVALLAGAWLGTRAGDREAERARRERGRPAAE
jgi:hypothetical protein